MKGVLAVIAVVALGLAALSSPLAAQNRLPDGELAALRPGVRVRVEAPGTVAGQLAGIVLTRSADTITIGDRNARPVAVPVARISTLELSLGKSRSAGAKTGLKWGLGIGAIGAFALIPVARSCGHCDKSNATLAWTTTSLFTGAIYGPIIGALIGGERWERYDLPRRTSVGVGAAGMTLVVSIPR